MRSASVAGSALEEGAGKMTVRFSEKHGWQSKKEALHSFQLMDHVPSPTSQSPPPFCCSIPSQKIFDFGLMLAVCGFCRKNVLSENH